MTRKIEGMQITEMLQRVHAGDRDALNSVIPLVYDELKKLARSHLRNESNLGSLETTALVHETFLRLSGGSHPSYESRAHFYGIASRLMRQILVDTARARAAAKRSAAAEVAIDGVAIAVDRPDESVLAIDEALTRLEKNQPLKANLIQMRYFGGMTAEECAVAVDLPVYIVRRELRLAQAWLRKEMSA